MATGLQSTNFDWQNDFIAHLTSDITNSATSIPIDSIPTPTEGILVIDPDTPANIEIIFYTSKTGTTVVTPANGRGYDNSTASAHLSGTKVIMAPVADMFRYIRTVATTTPQGWTPLSAAPNTVTALGNRSYSLVFNAVDYTATVSAGMRLKSTRTAAAPTQCTSLNGTTQYYSKTSPAGMTATNFLVQGWWIKLASYNGAIQTIASRYNGTSGFTFTVNASGQLVHTGFNAGSANFNSVTSYQSVPLNKWVHVSVEHDMSTSTLDGTHSWIMIDGADVPAFKSTGGTNPTALIQAGNLEIGSQNGGLLPFNGKIANGGIFSAAVTETAMRGYISQGLAGTETSLISAYSFNNSINDLNANANNLTANGSAVATNADSPFGGQAGGSISSTLDYAIVTAASFSTNTTLTVQVAEGCTIPTSGGVSAVSYATVKTPYGMPVQRDKWAILSLYKTNNEQTTPTVGTWYNVSSAQLNIPTGVWTIFQKTSALCIASSGTLEVAATLSTANNSESDSTFTGLINAAPATRAEGSVNVGPNDLTLSAPAVYYRNLNARVATSPTDLYDAGLTNPSIIRAELAYL